MVVSALIAAAALAAPPQGFYESKVLEPAAAFVAHKPMRVYCSLTNTDYRDWMAEQGGVFYSRGGTIVGSNETALTTDVCAPLRQQLRRAKVARYDFAAALSTLVHESIHARGVRDEGQTECAAMHEMPRVAVKFFHVKPGKQLRALMAQAWYFHRTLPAAYRSSC